MAIFTETIRAEIGKEIKETVSQISFQNETLTKLKNRLADLRKTVSEDTVNFNEADLAEVDALIMTNS